MTKKEKEYYYNALKEEEKEKALSTAATGAGAGAAVAASRAIKKTAAKQEASVARKARAKVASREGKGDIVHAELKKKGKGKNKKHIRNFAKPTGENRNLRTKVDNAKARANAPKESNDFKRTREVYSDDKKIRLERDELARQGKLKAENKAQINVKRTENASKLKGALKDDAKDFVKSAPSKAKNAGKTLKKGAKAGKKMAKKAAAKTAASTLGKTAAKALPGIGAALTAAELASLAKTMKDKNELERLQRIEAEKIRRGVNLQ